MIVHANRNTSEDEVKELLVQFGEVIEIAMIKDKATNMSKGQNKARALFLGISSHIDQLLAPVGVCASCRVWCRPVVWPW